MYVQGEMSFQRVKLKRKIFKIAFVLNTPINSEIVPTTQSDSYVGKYFIKTTRQYIP